nr:hypothetical protein [Legionella quinlivanii]
MFAKSLFAYSEKEIAELLDSGSLLEVHDE